jgi:hypothetical protein
MGLYCYARSGRPGSVEAVRAFLDDQAEVTLLEFGCVSQDERLGTFAARLLHDANYLERQATLRPLMPPAEIAAIHVPPLASDGGVGSEGYDDDARYVQWLAGEHAEWFTLEELGRAMPKLGQYQIVKGVGRSAPSPEIRRCLSRWLGDERLDETTRFAAASALTRDPDPAAGAALRGATNFLEKALGQQRAGALFRSWSVRREFAKRLDEADFRERLGPAFQIDHAMVLEQLPTASWFGKKSGAPDIAATWLALSARVGEAVEDWDTYSWLAPQLAHDLTTRKAELEALTEDERRTLQERCDEALRLHKLRVRPVPVERTAP